VGTKSVLFGAHCFFIHPFFAARGWWALYGCPWDPRLWVAFFLHDLGYVKKPNMDGPEGERHVELGARIMGRIFGRSWRDLCLCHSRYYAKRLGCHFSRLCVADKLAFVMTPAWLYIPMTRATGELSEYMDRAAERQAGGDKFTAEESALLGSHNPNLWLQGLKSYTRRSWTQTEQPSTSLSW